MREYPTRLSSTCSPKIARALKVSLPLLAPVRHARARGARHELGPCRRGPALDETSMRPRICPKRLRVKWTSASWNGRLLVLNSWAADGSILHGTRGGQWSAHATGTSKDPREDCGGDRPEFAGLR